MDQMLGITPADEQEQPEAAGGDQEDLDASQDDEQTEGSAVPKDEVLSFQVNCPECNSPTESRMKVVNIPFFKEIILMAMNCDKCGCKSNEVKSGSGVEPKGKRITLRVTDPSDMNRDILKSETCRFTIPELEFEYYIGNQAGKFTTLEGMIVSIKENFNLRQPFTTGDSADEERKKKIKEFTDKLDQILAAKMQVTVVLDDPAGNSYLQNLYAPEPDPEMTIVEYERTDEQNEELGLADMRTENYEGT